MNHIIIKWNADDIIFDYLSSSKLSENCNNSIIVVLPRMINVWNLARPILRWFHAIGRNLYVKDSIWGYG